MTFSDLNWHIAGVGKCDGDSVPDIIWRNYGTGADMIWYMYQNGTLRESKSITEVTDLGWTIVNGSDVGLVTLAPAPGSDSDPSRDEAQTPLDSKEKIKEIDLEDCGPVASVESPFKLTMAEKGSNQAFPGSAEADPLVGQGFFLAEPAASARGSNAFQVGPHRPETLNLVLAAQTTYYVYGFDGKLLAEYDQAGNCMKDYLYVGSKLVAEYQPASGKYYYYMSDQVNSTRMVTDDTGVVVHSTTYDPYGGPQKTWVKTYEPKLKFSGKEREIASELDYFGARYYDHIGYRFISTDPVINKDESYINPQLWNMYSYCDNNPITFNDPNGLDSVLGIHSDQWPSGGKYGQGHVWISLTDIETKKTATYGLYATFDRSKSDVLIDIEKDFYSAKYSRYYYIDTEQEKQLNDMVSKKATWWPWHNCSDWATDVVNKIVEEKIEARPSVGIKLPFGSPKKVSRSIIQKELKQRSSKAKPIHSKNEKKKEKKP